MGDFQDDTAVEPIGDGRFRATLSPHWATWGPAGGYVSSVALRAAGAVTEIARPVSYSCQFLSSARFEEVTLAVTSLRRGRRSEALRVEMTQGDARVLEAHVWAAEESDGMMEHDFTRMPDVPPPDELPTMAELEGREDSRKGFYGNLDQRPVGWLPPEERVAREPWLAGWFRYRPRPIGDDPFADAARAVIMGDILTWMATWPAHPTDGPLPWIAPNLDFYMRFHASMADSEWLFCEGRADLASRGLIGAETAVWTRDGQLAAAASSQLFCRERPARFR